MRRAFIHPRTLSALLLAASLLAAWPVRAQTGQASAAITAVDASAFPAMQAYAQVNDATGQHLRECAFTRAVWPHYGVDLPGIHLQVKTLEDLAIFNFDM